MSVLACQPQLSPDISSPLLKTRLAPRPLPSAAPQIPGRDFLHGQCDGNGHDFPAQVLPAQVDPLPSICVLPVPISLHYPRTGVWNEQLTCWCPQLLS